MASDVVDFLKSQWVESFKVEVQREALPFSQWSARFRETPPHVYLSAWAADYPDPDNFLRTGFSQQQAGWASETYHRLVQEASRTRDQATRIALYREADRILTEEAVIMPLEYGALYLLLKPWVTRFPCSVANKWLFCKDVVIEPH
jgi:ABC-type oligopeptide transport system substrate-binding subunit